MAYVKPAVQVYQELVSAGGAAVNSPDLPACIVGPLTSVITVDLTSSTSKIESIASTSDVSQVSATFDATPENDTLLYINVDSAKAGQQLNVDSISLTAEKPLVKTYEFTATSATSAGNAITLGDNEIGNITATASTPLSFYSTVNHVSLGDSVVVDGTTTSRTYISAINYTAGTITLNDSSISISNNDVISIYHKFSTLPVGAHAEPGVDGSVPYDDVNPLEADSTLTGYSMYSEVEIEGSGDSMSVYMGYSANRADLSGRILTISDVTDLTDILGVADSTNPLALGVSLALANSGGVAIYAIATDPRLSERDAHTAATELAEAQQLYNLVMLTQDLSIHATYKAHVNAMSLPSSGNWRIALTNCAIPDEDYLYGQPNSADGTDEDEYPDLLQKGTFTSATSSVSLPRGESAPLVYPGDYIKVYDLATDTYSVSPAVEANSGSLFTFVSGDWTTEEGDTTTAPADGSTIYFYAARAASKQGQAQWVASQASTWSDKRMIMFAGDVTIPNSEGLDEVLPGYYLMSALAGFLSGVPAQQPITKVTLAGISNIQHGNFYFTEAQLNIMAESGALIYVQSAQGTTPYCRHGLTTDVSVLEYREVLKVKNWDYLSYYYAGVLDPFIGTWNITSDTLQTIRQTVVSASEYLLTLKVAKIGAPLLSYSITTLEQSETSSDAIDLVMGVSIVNPNNYTNVHLQI